jgi:hypothetical protein
MRNPFLEEAWQNKARNEKGEEKNLDLPDGYERDVKIFKALKRQVEKTTEFIDKTDRENIREIYAQMMDSVERYNQTILSYNSNKSEKISKDDMEQSDFRRRAAHDALISNLDILARLMNKAGIDIFWKDAIGIDRKEVQRWAQNIMLYLQKEDEAN